MSSRDVPLDEEPRPWDYKLRNPRINLANIDDMSTFDGVYYHFYGTDNFPLIYSLYDPLYKEKRAFVVEMFNVPYVTDQDRSDGISLLSDTLEGTAFLSRATGEFNDYQNRFIQLYSRVPEYCYVWPFAVKAGFFGVNQILPVTTRDNFTILSLVVKFGYIDVAEDLIALGANVDGIEKSSPLAIAINSQQRDMVDLLLNKGANPNRKNDNLFPMSLAICGNDVNIVYLLTIHGADPSLIDSGFILTNLKNINIFIEFLDTSGYSIFLEQKTSLITNIVRVCNYFKAEHARVRIPLLMLKELIKRGATSDMVVSQYKKYFDRMAPFAMAIED